MKQSVRLGNRAIGFNLRNNNRLRPRPGRVFAWVFLQHVYDIRYIVKFRINWALSNSLNTYNRHSDWHKLEVCGTKMSTYLWASL